MRLPEAFFARPIAHRTLHDVRAGRPENSLSGARAAMAAGYGIEVDVQLSADGVPVVFHDDFLQRLTPRLGPVRDHSAETLCATRLTHGAEAIPTLEALLRLVDGAVPLLIEIKDQDGALGADTRGMEEAVGAVVRGYGGPIALMSFNPHAVAGCARYAPEVPRGLVTEAFAPEEWPGVPEARLQELVSIPDYDRVGACFISHDVSDLGSPEVARLQAAGTDVLCWTVRSAEVEKTARKVARNVTFEGYLA